MKIGRPYYIIPFDDNTAMVVATSDSHHHIVDLEVRTCTCLEFQDLGIPCQHACATCTEYHCDPEMYVEASYSLIAYCNTYNRPFSPFTTRDLTTMEDCKAPVITATRGRPPKKQKRKGEGQGQGKRAYKCSYCHSTKHNQRSCRRGGQQTVGGTRD